MPDIPETLDIKIKRERYLAKQALADAEQLLQQVLNNKLSKNTSYFRRFKFYYSCSLIYHVVSFVANDGY